MSKLFLRFEIFLELILKFKKFFFFRFAEFSKALLDVFEFFKLFYGL